MTVIGHLEPSITLFSSLFPGPSRFHFGDLEVEAAREAGGEPPYWTVEF